MKLKDQITALDERVALLEAVIDRLSPGMRAEVEELVAAEAVRAALNPTSGPASATQAPASRLPPRRPPQALVDCMIIEHQRMSPADQWRLIVLRFCISNLSVPDFCTIQYDADALGVRFFRSVLRRHAITSVIQEEGYRQRRRFVAATAPYLVDLVQPIEEVERFSRLRLTDYRGPTAALDSVQYGVLTDREITSGKPHPFSDRRLLPVDPFVKEG